MKRKKKLSDQVILRISAGDPEALEKLIQEYDSYFNSLATDKYASASGRTIRIVNNDRKSYIILRVIEAAVKWRPRK